MFKQVIQELNALPEGYIVLLETNPEHILDLNIDVIKTLTQKGYLGIILSTSRPYSNIISLYKKNGIDTNRIFLLDCITKSQSASQQKAGNVMYLEDVSGLTQISLSLKQAMEEIQGNRFVFVDSINTMLIYNKPTIFAKFIHTLMTRMRVNGITGLLVSLENETNREVRAEIAQLCDKIIKV